MNENTERPTALNLYKGSLEGMDGICNDILSRTSTPEESAQKLIGVTNDFVRPGEPWVLEGLLAPYVSKLAETVRNYESGMLQADALRERGVPGILRQETAIRANLEKSVLDIGNTIFFNPSVMPIANELGLEPNPNKLQDAYADSVMRALSDSYNRPNETE
ncbi:MAG: hypothetical protein Q8Q42_00800 [Nanoarchaeota archaeon]|nr:hypothetical protein [Nanoarchaeota archaeon]